ncbi:ParB N-terminal domain-containing protein [Roseitalea porphyridii]|uniref:ParB/Sulfiredoxin domain-containing protein n=1 Tax=Roseitalea porphyridii TaxID=1852022 RepID=A0A4P6V1V9_9HYPH|nr:ParB N-terminal domain-containing protein [Roseitalea porphyridii]QBK31362.1 hypothetical protein E0E05_12560 [Roseitalea porphyridii]
MPTEQELADIGLDVGKTTKVPVHWLAFDPENPRFVPGKEPQGVNPVDVIRNLVQQAELGELLQSIAQNGYIGIEPMIVMHKDGALVVLEGNRRLAAVLALRDPSIAADARIALPDFIADRESLEMISVHRVTEREDAQDIIGFKHINGPRPWDAYAKARFAAAWLNREKKKGKHGMTLREIAQRMGDRHNTLRRMVLAVEVLEQARRHSLWEIDDRTSKKFAFSHLYTGLSYQQFVDFLELVTEDERGDPPKDPVPLDRHDKLARLLGWLFGDRREDVEPIIQTQAKDLKRVRDVLGSPKATIALETDRNLDAAYAIAEVKGEALRRGVYAARVGLREALADTGSYDAETHKDVLDTALEVRSSARALVAAIETPERD